MIQASFKKICLAMLVTAAALPAHAHVGAGATSSFAAGFSHPLSGLDHMIVMVAVGLWATLKGGKAVVAWPVAFAGVMLAGGALGMLHVPLPFVETATLASVVVIGLIVALAVNLPIAAGVAIVGSFALFHGHAHGIEAPDNATGLEYLAGFAVATALLHAAGISVGLGFGTRSRGLVRAAGAACAMVGVGLAFGAL